MRRFYISYKQVKMTYSLPCAFAVFCGKFIITVNRDYLYAPKQGKLTSVCLQRFSSIFKLTVADIGILCFFHGGHLETIQNGGWDPRYRVLTSWFIIRGVQ